MGVSLGHTDALPPAASISDLNVRFPGQAEPLFDQFDLEINQGEKVLLLGPSGSGKSTLLKVLTGLIPGTIELPVRWESRSCFTSWGYVFQDPDAQFCMPYVDEEIAFVLENLATPQASMPELIEHYLSQVGLQFEDPHRSIETLSRGQKQRLALASALALEPDALVLDEPTALLDPEGTKDIWEQIQKVHQDKTLLIVEHKIAEVIGLIDRVVVLNEQGQLLIDDSVENLADHRSLLDQYGIWHKQSWETYDVENKPLTGVKKEKTGRPVLEIEKIVGYRENIPCVEIENRTVDAGDWIAITGPNGAGKSTLLLALMKLINADGSWSLNGQKVESTEQIASDIGFVFQNPELQFVEQKVYDEVAFTLQKCGEQQAAQKVKAVLRDFGLADLAEKHPFQLSKGQQRRLSVASTTIKNRQILLLDEPTFGQDAAHTFRILDHIEALRKKGVAILMVTHDRQVVKRFATREWVLDEGSLDNEVPDLRAPEQDGEISHVV